MISEAHSFLFIHRGKSGGNSLSKKLLPFCKNERIIAHNDFQDGIRYFDVKNIKYKTRKHASLEEVKSVVPNRLFNSLLKFTTIRNPYDRLVSAYWSPNRVNKRNIKTFEASLFIKIINKQRTFRDFTCLKSSDKLDEHMDFIIKFEDMGGSISKLSKILGLNIPNIPHINKSNRKHYSHYITPKLKLLIDEKFAEEIDFFNYKFEKE